MRRQYVPLEQIQHVVEGFNHLYTHMLKTGKIDADEMKNIMEPYFTEAGYREVPNNSKIKGKSKHHQTNSQKNILIIHDAGVGDFIVLSATIREIRRIYSNAYITLLMDNTAASMAEHCPYIDKLVAYPTFFKKYEQFFGFYKNLITMAVNLLGQRLDIAFNCGHYPGAQLLSYMSGAKERIFPNFFQDFNSAFQVGDIPRDFFSNLATSIIPTDYSKTHDNEHFLDIVINYAKCKVTNKKLEVWLSPADHFKAELNLQRVSNKKLYAIVMGGNVNLKCKRWAPENYAKLINLILEEEEAIFVILGGAEELKSAEIIESLVDKKYLVNLAAQLNYRQSAAVLNLCDYYIGNDTGLMHAAAALNIPVLSPNCFPADIQPMSDSFLVRFYPYDVPSVMVQPARAFPECKKSQNTTTGCAAKDSHCINQITPEKMMEALKILNKQIEKKSKSPYYMI